MIILDTNVLSEVMKPSPDATVLRWLAAQPRDDVFTTTVTKAEILLGLALLPKGRRSTTLCEAADVMFSGKLAGRVLPFDDDAVTAYALIASTRRSRGRPISPFDAVIAAIARSRGAALATRNVADFDACGVTVVNPWTV